MKNQTSMFDAPPLASNKRLCEVPQKCWRDETHASSEGREFLRIITEVAPETIDADYSPDAICAWLEEMGYRWKGASWVAEGEIDADL
ncbi:MAG: hypothetical protein KY445_08190 [Armatimonadetes bacterium]|nr:hypothetical protein [Armatimonadota bacterium]